MWCWQGESIGSRIFPGTVSLSSTSAVSQKAPSPLFALNCANFPVQTEIIYSTVWTIIYIYHPFLIYHLHENTRHTPCATSSLCVASGVQDVDNPRRHGTDYMKKYSIGSRIFPDTVPQWSAISQKALCLLFTDYMKKYSKISCSLE